MGSPTKKDPKAIAQEMLPFAIYTVVPLLLIVLIAYTFGAVR